MLASTKQVLTGDKSKRMLFPQQSLLDDNKLVNSLGGTIAMDIAIIGAGNVGRALATSFTRAGHSVVITSHDPEDAGAVATATRARVATSNAEAAAGAAVVILATPFSSAQDIAAEVTNETRGKIVVDATNRMSFGAAGPEIDTSTSNAE